MNRILSLFLRKASKIPLIPSPGRPKAVSTPQPINLSTITSPVVFAISGPPQGVKGSLPTATERRTLHAGARATGRTVLNGLVVSGKRQAETRRTVRWHDPRGSEKAPGRSRSAAQGMGRHRREGMDAG